MNYDMKRSGAYIQNLRIQYGYTQEELSRAVNIDRSFLSRIESGKKGCSVDLFIQLAEFFCVSLDELILGPEIRCRHFAESREQLNADIAALVEHLKLFQSQL